MTYTLSPVPEFGAPITPGRVPDCPIIPFVAGDGIGPEVWSAARRALDAAVAAAYPNRRIAWMEVFAGQTAQQRCGAWLPEETLRALREFRVGIKGPLATPVGGSMRSLNVALRRELDLYVCQRPMRWFEGVPSPMRRPDQVDMVVFRENTEDLYAGIEFEAGSEESARFLNLLRGQFPAEYARLPFPETSGIGLKPISRQGSQRLVRAALRWALANQRRSLTLVHKGNIMKYTEGAFRAWGYNLAESEFAAQTYTQRQWEHTRQAQGEPAAETERRAALDAGRLWVKDVITDAMFEAAITRPGEFDVLAATNLNGDYLSDALAALVGGMGMAPGGNINDETGAAVFEATHGTAPAIAGKNIANPCSLILSGEMLLRFLGWDLAADRLLTALQSVFAARRFTPDLAAQTAGAQSLSTMQFADALVETIVNREL